MHEENPPASQKYRKNYKVERTFGAIIDRGFGQPVRMQDRADRRWSTTETTLAFDDLPYRETQGDLLTAERSATLVSGETGSWADVTTIRIEWTFHFLGSRAGMCKASPVKVSVVPSNPAMVTGSTLRILERFQISGTVAKQEEFRLARTGANYEAEFEWDSTVNNPEQEITVQLDTTTPDTPSILLADPISRRRDFLISFPAQS